MIPELDFDVVLTADWRIGEMELGPHYLDNALAALERVVRLLLLLRMG